LFASSGQSFIPCGGAVSVSFGRAARVGNRKLDFVFAFCSCAPGLVQQLCADWATRQFSSPAALALDGVASAAIAFMLPQPNIQPPAIHTETLTARSNRVSLMNKATFIAASLLPCGPIVEKTLGLEKHKSRKPLQGLCNRWLVSLIGEEQAGE
jgi:hypothetical protein